MLFCASRSLLLYQMNLRHSSYFLSLLHEKGKRKNYEPYAMDPPLQKQLVSHVLQRQTSRYQAGVMTHGNTNIKVTPT